MPPLVALPGFLWLNMQSHVSFCSHVVKWCTSMKMFEGWALPALLPHFSLHIMSEISSFPFSQVLCVHHLFLLDLDYAHWIGICILWISVQPPVLPFSTARSSSKDFSPFLWSTFSSMQRIPSSTLLAHILYSVCLQIAYRFHQFGNYSFSFSPASLSIIIEKFWP